MISPQLEKSMQAPYTEKKNLIPNNSLLMKIAYPSRIISHYFNPSSIHNPQANG
jgi:hypothetical protein